jgi:hypothetical protein
LLLIAPVLTHKGMRPAENGFPRMGLLVNSALILWAYTLSKRGPVPVSGVRGPYYTSIGLAQRLSEELRPTEELVEWLVQSLLGRGASWRRLAS